MTLTPYVCTYVETRAATGHQCEEIYKGVRHEGGHPIPCRHLYMRVSVSGPRANQDRATLNVSMIEDIRAAPSSGRVR
jgi:hypothetical protein